MAIEVSPELSDPAISSLQTAMLLRDQLHRIPPINEPGLAFTSTAELLDIADAYHHAIIKRNRANFCGGRAYFFMAALRAFGLHARLVSLYRDVIESPQPAVSHLAVDAQIDGKSVAFDPWFNLCFTDTRGNFVGWHDVIMAARVGSAMISTSCGFPVLPGRSVAEYEEKHQTTFLGLLNHAIFHGDSSGEIECLNPGWDGLIRYADGTTFDAFASARWSPFSE